MTFTTNGPGEMSLGTADRAAAVAEVKAALRVAVADDDALIAAFAETALGLAEQFLGRVLILRAVTERVPGSRCWQPLGAMPVMAITSVAGVDGDTVTPLAVDDYAIDLDAEANGWVRVAGDPLDTIEIVYQAGWIATWSLIPAPVRQGVVLLAAHLYSERDASEPPPAAVTALWRPFRRVALDRAVHA
ncbi:hypothetical protein FPZ24_15405 [Sphingomonas panacisoli]|uniref:PhiE125 gp8 family phage protein n=1 Tax=Sphingomonas panacisoli TaxID=1813879 RepID=A0A5B8LKK4_9SPHN|nr:hypothetical protein [Sphingomonas panacisoli]QDZ08681.1 hypothetical protein FPZ24_15405 [Sphingomonas panacisoli]